jgi:hypothetical protein
MKKVTNNRLLLQKLRMAVCLQIKFWDACAEVQDILGDCDDAVFLVERVAQFLPWREFQLADLDAIRARFRKTNPTAAVNKLSQEMQHTLLVLFQNAVRLQKESIRWADSLAKALGRTREQALMDICNFAVDADTGMELNERDLHMLLREPEARGRVRVGRPLES